MKTVVILLSDKRSGSTMLQNALCSHKEIQTVNYSPHTYLETQHWLKAAVLLDKNKSLFSNGKPFKNYGSRKNARIYLEDELKGNLPDFIIPKDDKQLVFQGWDALCEKFAKPVFFEKSPQHLAHWAALSLLLEWAYGTTKFEVKFIGLIRNPLAVQYSAFKLFRSVPNNRQYGWLNIYKNLLVFKSLSTKNEFFITKYEDIVDDSKKELKAICDFIGIQFDTQMLNEIHGNSLTKWNDDIHFNLKLSPSVIQLAKYFGYTDFQLNNINTKELTYWKNITWNIKTLLMKFKNRIINRIIIPIKLRLK